MLFFVFIALVAYHAVAVSKVGDKFVVRAEASAARVVRDVQNRLVEDIRLFQRAVTVR